jgi:hypothetical protein
MDAARATLHYGQPERRNRRRAFLIVMGVLLACTAGVGWMYRAPLAAFFAHHYADFRYARAFDRARGDLLAGGDLWLGPAASQPADDRGERHLRALAPQFLNRGSVGQHVVLFVRGGETAGQRWLAFACVGPGGFELFTFERDGRLWNTSEMLMQTPGAPLTALRPPAVVATTPEGNTVRIRFDVDGGRNELLWALNPAGAGRGLGLNASSFVVPGTVTPLTGWVSPTQWFPATHGFRLIEGRRPDRDLATDGGGMALSFLPDGRLASAGPFRVSLIEIDSEERERHGLPLDLSPSDSFSFSPDGTKLFVGGHSQAAGLIDVLDGRARRYSHSTSGRAMAAFPDNDTLIVIDAVQRVKLNWDSLKPERLDIGKLDRGVVGFGAAGARVALPRDGDAVVTDLSDMLEVARIEISLTGQYPLYLLSLSPDGQWLAIKGNEGLRLADVRGRETVWHHQGDIDWYTPHAQVKWSADGLRGAAAGNQWVYVWSMAEPRWVARLPHGMTGEFFDVALSPDGRRLAASARGFKTIAYWPDLDAALGLKADVAATAPSESRNAAANSQSIPRE